MPSSPITLAEALEKAHKSINEHIPFPHNIQEGLNILFPYNSQITNDDLLVAASIIHDQITPNVPATTESLHILAGRIFQDRLINHNRIERESREQIEANAAMMAEIQEDIRLNC